jgi:hypothetical protein
VASLRSTVSSIAGAIIAVDSESVTTLPIGQPSPIYRLTGSLDGS